MPTPMPTEPPQPRHFFRASQVLPLLDLVERWGIAPEALLGPFGIDRARLEVADARLSLQTMVALTERARALTREPGLGIYLGLQKNAMAYGSVGFAAMSASTLREALEQFIEFAPALTTAVEPRLHVDGDRAALVVHEHVDVGSIRDVALLSLFVGLRQITGDLTGRRPGGTGEVAIPELAIPKPPYFSRFADVLPGARFDQPLNQLVFPAVGLDLPLARPNRAALNLARRQCQEQLARLGFDGSLTAHVRRALVTPDGFRTIEGVAAHLHLSVRTLKRRLAAQGATYSELLQEERKLRGLHLLRSGTLTVDEIATRLGYSTTYGFTRAFKRWTGNTPAAYRRALPALLEH